MQNQAWVIRSRGMRANRQVLAWLDSEWGRGRGEEPAKPVSPARGVLPQGGRRIRPVFSLTKSSSPSLVQPSPAQSSPVQSLLLRPEAVAWLRGSDLRCVFSFFALGGPGAVGEKGVYDNPEPFRPVVKNTGTGGTPSGEKRWVACVDVRLFCAGGEGDRLASR